MYACQIPNMILQPLAENAILHGLDHKTTIGPGIITIRCYRDKEDIVIKVMDNGCGMPEHVCEKILTSQSKGYGVSNVQQRIQLFYGEEYGLRYRSTLQAGTCVEVRVAVRLPDNQID